jgi:predicted small metal-binding protein
VTSTTHDPPGCYQRCRQICGFSVRSHDQDELVRAYAVHAQRRHGLALSERDVLNMVLPA